MNATPGGTNNQNGAFTFTDTRAGGTGPVDRERRRWAPFTNYAELGQRNFTRVALAGDRRVHSGLLEAADEPDHRRRRALGLLAAVVLDDQQHRQFHGVVLRSEQPGGHRSDNWVCSLSGPDTTASCCRATASKGTRPTHRSLNDPAVLALFRGVPRGFSETHSNAFEPRLGVSYALDEKTILRGERRHLP